MAKTTSHNSVIAMLYRLFTIACLGSVLFGAAMFIQTICVSPRNISTATLRASSSTTAANLVAVSHGAHDVDWLTKPIQEVRVGERVGGDNPLREEVEGIEPAPSTWGKISFIMKKGNGGSLWIDLLRPLAWIEDRHVQLGSIISLDLYEMGAVGDAEVKYVGPCPQIASGPGNVVTGTFKHQADETTAVVRLQLEDQIELTGVTANHPYWSEDRQDFVDVGQLRPGELVDTEFGPKQVIAVTPIQHDGFLYNLETTEHVYRVGSLGTLVHNFCVHKIKPDSQGRVRSAIAHITPADIGTGTATNTATRQAARSLGNSTDDAGHLIGRLLGGPGGKRSGNFFAQNPHINRGQFAQLEQRVADFVRNGDDVWIRVTPQYAGSGTRATGVLYQVRVNGNTIISQLFAN